MGLCIFVEFQFLSKYLRTYQTKKVISLDISTLTSGEGVKIDYLTLNITGYSALCVYSTAGYFNHTLGIGVVDFEDLVFAYHGWIMTNITIFLVLYFPVN